jgi:hypothetical protein
MNVASFVRELRLRGVTFEAVDGRLRWQAPPGVVTEELLGQLRERKAEVLALVSSELPSVFDELQDLAAPWRGATRELGELAGFPRLSYRAGHAVAPGAANWGVFVGRASLPDLQLVVAALREMLASMQQPEDER